MSNQSSVIFFFLFAAYFVFITIRGELPIYMGLLLASPPPSGSGGTSTASTSGGDVAKYAETAASVAAFL